MLKLLPTLLQTQPQKLLTLLEALQTQLLKLLNNPGPTIQQNIRMHLIISELCTWILNFL